MKRILVAIFAIWTFAMFGQNVNPETFPLLSGSIGDKNLYTNTSGEGKISIKTIWDSVKITDTVSTTYADFYTLITGGNLQVGKTYILIDFQTIYDQMDFDAGGNLKSSLTTKTGAIEEIWVLALAPDRIASTAYSKTYPNDRIQYDWTYNATLVNGTPAKGRISERIDEWNNRTDYDHREIKFIRYDDGNGNFVQINDSGRTSQEFLTFGNNYGAGGIIHDNWLGDFYSIGQFLGQEYSNNVFQGGDIISNKTNASFYNNTFLSYTIFSTYLGEVSNNINLGTIENFNISGDYNYNRTSNNINNVNISGNYNHNIDVGISNIDITGVVEYNIFNIPISYSIIYTRLENTLINGINGIENCYFTSNIQNKTIDESTYPFLFGTTYEKRIFKASDGNVYARYFDGTNDINVLIP